MFIGTAVVADSMGNSHKGDVHSLGTEFNEGWSGVYLFLKQEPFQSGYTILYVGQTASFAQRLNYLTAHHKWACAEARGATNIMTLVVWGERVRLALERDLIQTYDPPCNN